MNYERFKEELVDLETIFVALDDKLHKYGHLQHQLYHRIQVLKDILDELKEDKE